MKDTIEQIHKLWELITERGMVLLLGIAIVVGSFCSKQYLGLNFEEWDVLLLISLGVVIALFGLFTNEMKCKSHKKIEIKNNALVVDTNQNSKQNSVIEIVLGKIQDYRCVGTKAVGLPMNKEFNDKCLMDEKSSSGAYVKACLQSDLLSSYDSIMSLFSTTEKRIGCVQLCKNFMSKGDNILFTAVTEVGVNGHIYTTTTNIRYSVQEIIKEARKNKFDEIVVPVFGTGHGGIPQVKAICSLIDGAQGAINDYKFNNMKLKIVVFEKEFSSLKELKKELINEFRLN